MSTEHPAASELLANATAATVAAVSSTAKANIAVRVTEAPASALAIDPIINHVGDGIFLQAKTAQIFAGICVWMALFITCQQVSDFVVLLSPYVGYRTWGGKKNKNFLAFAFILGSFCKLTTNYYVTG
uniref:Uncharacterized protein n=1 Tax=Anopheles maculatus TaxID=74869 RepID=A0A182SW77_9DIPT